MVGSPRYVFRVTGKIPRRERIGLGKWVQGDSRVKAFPSVIMAWDTRVTMYDHISTKQVRYSYWFLLRRMTDPVEIETDRTIFFFPPSQNLLGPFFFPQHEDI